MDGFSMRSFWSALLPFFKSGQKENGGTQIFREMERPGCLFQVEAKKWLPCSKAGEPEFEVMFGKAYSAALAVCTGSMVRHKPRGWSCLWSRGSQALWTNMRHWFSVP